MERDSYDPLLLTTKLAIPPSYLQKIMPRTTLYEQLDSGLQRPLLLINAPAGFGKTTLVSEWIKQRGIAAAWVSLENTDNDLALFWRYCITALSQLRPDLLSGGEIWQQLLQLNNIEMILTTLINTLMDSSEKLVLVLDDYYTITNPAIHQSLIFLLDHLPSPLHLIIITRHEPSLQLARSRVQGKLYELRATDLRFTREEAANFLTQSMGLTLTNDDISELTQRTDGWLAGLQLAAHSLQGKSNPIIISNFIKTFSGTNRHVLDYLTDEVLLQQPEEVQNFLLQTAILDKINADLCNTITQQHNSDAMIEYLDQANLFIIPLDSQHSWFRYDRLFVDLLRHRLKQKYDKEHIALLHQQASTWYEQHGMYMEAISHAIKAANIDRIANLIENAAWFFIQHGEEPLVYQWLTSLPESTLHTRPILSFFYAYTLLYQHKMAKYEQTLTRVEQLWQVEANSTMLSWVHDLRAYVALLRGAGSEAIIYAQKALELIPTENTIQRGSTLTNLGAGYLYTGELTLASKTLLEGYHLSQKGQSPTVALMASLYLGELQMAQGNLRAAGQTFQQVLLEAGEHMARHRIAAHTRLADIYYEWNELISARSHSLQAMQLSESSPHAGFAPAQRFLIASRLEWSRGELELALQLLSKAEQSAQRFGKHAFLQAQIAELRVQYLLAHNELSVAKQWFEQYYIQAEEQISSYEREAWSKAYARLLIAQNQPMHAITVLQQQQALANQQQRVESQLKLYILLTLAYQAEGSTQQTMQSLEQALLIGAQSSYTRLFIDEGDTMAALLGELYSRYQRRANSETQSIPLGYLYTLLSSFGEEAQPPLWQITPGHENILLDKLSEREFMVLGLIAEGLSNQEIAQKLVVTVSTIKTHLNNIYAKLHVHTRLQAVTRAYDLGLLRRSEVETEPLAHPRSSERI